MTPACSVLLQRRENNSHNHIDIEHFRQTKLQKVIIAKFMTMREKQILASATGIPKEI